MAGSEKKPVASVPKKSKVRSPNYPLVGLERAVELATMMHKQYGTHPVPLPLLHELWKVTKGSNTGNQWVAALASYGLIDVTGENENRRAAISKDGIRIIGNAPDREQLLRDAAVRPAIHKEIMDHYGSAGLPANALLEQYLVWDRPEGRRFNADSVKSFIARFRGTLDYAGGIFGSKIDEDEDADEESSDSSDTSSSGSSSSSSSSSSKKQERRRMIPEGSQEFAFELEEGPAVLTLPQGIGKGSTEDLEDWLKLVVRKIKRTTKPATDSEPETDQDDEDE